MYPFKFLEGFIDEPLLLTRNENDKLQCLSNVCTHRGNILVDTPCQDKKIRCDYHGRQFDLNGNYKKMPETEGMKNFPSKDDDLPALPLETFGKFLFTSIDPAFDFEELVKPMKERVGWMPFEEFIFKPEYSTDYLVNANWALYCDNYLEGFHIPFVHPDLAKEVDYSEYTTEVFKYSNLQMGIAKGGEHTFDLPDDSPDKGKDVAAYYFWLFPNLTFNFYPWGLSMNIIKPLKKDLTKVSFRSYVRDADKLTEG
ncbi:MAG: SRPBCC family protein, partial [Flavobacteriales bacterium]